MAFRVVLLSRVQFCPMMIGNYHCFFLKDYVINFVLWWYTVEVVNIFNRAYTWMGFMLNYTNTLVMAQNLFVPMYKDTTSIGKSISFIVRITWIWFGGIATTIVTLPVWILAFAAMALPVIVIAEIVIGLIHII